MTETWTENDLTLSELGPRERLPAEAVGFIQDHFETDEGGGSDGRSYLWRLHRAGELAGLAWATPISAVMWLHYIALNDAMRCAGGGRLLMRSIAATAKDLQLPSIGCQPSWEGDRQRRLGWFTRLGFTEDDDEDHRWHGPADLVLARTSQ